MLKRPTLRESLSFMRGNIRVLTATQLIGTVGRSLVMPYASLYILSLGGRPSEIGLVNSLSPLAGLLAFPIAGYLADHAGRVKLVAISGFFSALIFLLYAFAPSWEWLALGALIRGFLVISFPATSAIMADSLEPQDRGRGMAAMNTIAGVPAMFAPYIAGAFLDRVSVVVGMRYLYAVLMIAYMANAAINWRFLQETTGTCANGIGFSDLPRSLKNAYSGIPSMLRRFSPTLRALAFVVILGFMANAIAGPFWVVYAVDHIGLSRSQWGLALLIETALRNVMNIPAGMIVDRFGRTRCMLGALVLSLVSLPLFILAQTFWAVVAIRSAAAVSTAFFVPACSALMADTVPRDIRGRVMAAIGRGSVMIGAASGGTGGPGLGYLVTIPLMIASFSAGYLYGHDPMLPWYCVFGLTLAAIFISIFHICDPQEAEV